MALLLPKYMSCPKKVTLQSHVRRSRGHGPAGHVWPEGAWGEVGWIVFCQPFSSQHSGSSLLPAFSMKRPGQKTHLLRMYILTLSHSSADITGRHSPSCGFAAYELETSVWGCKIVYGISGFWQKAQLLHRQSQFFSDVGPPGRGKYPDPCLWGAQHENGLSVSQGSRTVP